MFGEMPIGTQRAHAEFGRRRVCPFDLAGLEQRNEHVGAGVVGGRAVSFLLDRAPPRQAANREVKPVDDAAGLVDGGRIKRPDRHLVLLAGKMRVDVEHPVRLVFQVVGCGRERRDIRGYSI